jgi:hypothetical protein
MDCPRCGVPNLPGLTRCVDCAQPMEQELAVPPRWVPPVQAANPLRVRRPRPPRSWRLPRLRAPRIPVAWLVLASAMLGLLALALLGRGLRDPLLRFGMAESRLAAGTYRVDDDALETLAVGELVLLAREGEVQPTVVVALEGQRLDQGEGSLLVDGLPSEAEPVLPWDRQPLAEDWEGVAVPTGQVAVWDWAARGCQRCLGLAVVPRDSLMGRISQRRDEGGFVPVAWPPPGPNDQEEP